MKAELIERLAQRAEAEGLLDVAYAEVDSPLGKLLVATTPKGPNEVLVTMGKREFPPLAIEVE